MTSLEQEHKLRNQMLVEHNLSDDELDALIKDKIDAVGGYIDARAAMHLLNKELAEKEGKEVVPLEISPEQKARDKIMEVLEEKGLTTTYLDEMVEKLQSQSMYIKKDKMLAYELIAKHLGVTLIEDREAQVRALKLSTVEDILNMPYEGYMDVRGLVIGQRVQRKKGGEWTRLYTTTIIDTTGKTLTMKTGQGDNEDFSHLFLHWGNWYNFYGINRSQGAQRKDTNGNPLIDDYGEEMYWDDTWWWRGECDQLYDISRTVPATSIKQMHDTYQNYVVKGVISNFRKLRNWSLFDPFADNFLSSQAVNQPKDKKIRDNLPGEQTLGEDGVYIPWSARYRFSLTTPNGRVEVSTRGFDITLAAWQRIGDGAAQRRMKSKSEMLDGCEVLLFGNMTENPNTHQPLFMAHGLLTVKESGQFDGVQGVLDNLLGDMIPAADEPKNDVPVDVSEEPETFTINKLTDQLKKNLIPWYAQHIAELGRPQSFKEFQDAVWRGFGLKASDKQMHTIIDYLKDEGMINEFKGAMIYPNI